MIENNNDGIDRFRIDRSCKGASKVWTLNTGMHLKHSAHARNLFTTIIMLDCYQCIISNHYNTIIILL
jgi:hypothetical protein